MATGSDSAFLAGLAGNSGEAQGADDWAGINADLEELLRDLALGAGSKPFLIMTPAAAKDLAVRGLVNGVDSLRWNGGTYAGVRNPSLRCADAGKDHRGGCDRPCGAAWRSRT